MEMAIACSCKWLLILLTIGLARSIPWSGDHIVLYRPGTGTIWIQQHGAGNRFTPVYAEGDPGRGIGGYDLRSPDDRVFTLDYDGGGRQTHLVLYRPGTGTVWILRNSGGSFAPVFAEGDPGRGIGGYDLRSRADRGFAFDFESSGRMDHIVFYRPGTGTIWILKRDSKEGWKAVYAQGDPGQGIGGYDLKHPGDRALAFDYDGTGKCDHLVLYRPEQRIIYILRNEGGKFSPVFQSHSGIGGYDLASPADRIFAFDYNGSHKLDHLVVYRPGTGTIWILQRRGSNFVPVYSQGDPGAGIGGYDLKSKDDRAFAFDYDKSGLMNHLVLYRPGTGTMWILKNEAGSFRAVYAQGDPGNGIGGYDLKSRADRAFAFIYKVPS